MASKRKPGINWTDDAASGLRKIIEKALAGGSKTKAQQAIRVATKAKKTAKKQGKVAQVASMEKMRQTGRATAAQATAREAALKKAVFQREKADALKKQTKRFNKVEVERAKGQGIYTSTTGKTKRVGTKRAGQGRRTAGAIESQMRKEAAMEKKLREAMKAAQGVPAKRDARKKLEAFLKKTGRG